MKKQIKRKAAIITIAIFLAIALLLATYGTLRLYSSSTGTLSGGWIHAFSNSVEYLGLTVDKSQVSGQEQEEYETTGTPPQVNPRSSNISGTINGTNVSLTFSVYSFPVRTYTGLYENDTLTLTAPDQAGNLQSVEYHHATTDDYNSAVQKLQQTVAQQVQDYENAIATATATAYQQQIAEATATAISDEQQRLAYDISDIGGSIKQLSTDSDFSSLIAGYQKDLGAEQNDWHTEQSDARGGCNNYPQVQADSNQIQADSNQIQADDNQFQSDNSQIQTDTSTVQDFMQKIQQHWNDLGKQSFSGVSANDVSDALQRGNAAINQAKSNIQGAQSQVSSFDAQSAQIAKQAQALSDGMHC